MSSTAAEVAVEAAVRRSSRTHRVTAIVVAHDGERWLPRTLTALADLTRKPDRLVLVDTGSTDASPDLLTGADLTEHIVTLAADTSFGEGVNAALQEIVDLPAEPTIDLRGQQPALDAPVVDWVWLLHDDSAPQPDALARLLRQADDLADAAIVGPKLRGWGRPDVLLECGLALSGAGRPERGVGRGEVDQGQLDGRTDVLAVSSAGMLIRRDLWDRLGGFGTAFPAEGADLDFCWRARRAGARVVVAPRAVVHHRRAATTGRREVAARGTRRYRHRRTSVVTALIHAPLWRLPFTGLRLAAAGLLRFLLGLVMLAPRRAFDDLAGTIVGLLSGGTVVRGRRAVRRTAAIPERQLRHLRPTLGQRIVHLSDHVVAPRLAGAGPVSRRWSGFLRAVVGVSLGLGVLCLIAGWGLWFGDGRLSGGALLPAPDGALDLLGTFTSPWHEVGLGSAAAAPPYLLLVAAASTLLLGSATTAVQVLILAAPVFAAASLLVALRGLVRRPVAVLAAVTYALLPAVIESVDTGRLGTAVGVVLLPLAVRVLVRCLGVAGSVLPVATIRTWVAAVVLLAALGAFSPALAVTLIVLALLTSVVTGRFTVAWRLLVATAAVAALLWPWSATFAGAPGSLLLDIGAHPGRLADVAPTWQLALVTPPGPTAPPVWLTVPLLVLALLALVPGRTRPAVVGAWLLVLAGSVLAVLQNGVAVTVPWSAAPVAAWPGAGTALMGLGLILAVVAALSGLRGTVQRTVLVVVALTPVLVGAWWAAEGESLLRRTDPQVVSPFVSVASTGPEAPRSLALSLRPDDTIEYEILSGVGPRLGDADMAPPLADLADFGSAVSRMTAGSAEGLAEIADWAVRYVTADVAADRQLARRLDAVPGLRRVSTIDGQGLWEVGDPVPRVAASTPAGASPLAADILGPALSAVGPIPADATAIRVAEQPSPVWRASLAGVELAASDGSQQVFAVPPGASGEVVVSASPTSRLVALIVPAAVALALLGAAMWPARREGDA